MISAYIIYSWGLICMNQVDKIVGKGAPTEFIQKLEELANSHHEQLEVDVLRAYYFGSKFICEVRCASSRLFKLLSQGLCTLKPILHPVCMIV